jgi:hypothetical protein
MGIQRSRPSALTTLISRGPFAARLHGLLIALLLALPLSAASQGTPNQDVIQAETRIVLVNVVVKDKHGKPVDDLSRDDLVLLYNGQEQKTAPLRGKRSARRQQRWRVRRAG